MGQQQNRQTIAKASTYVAVLAAATLAALALLASPAYAIKTHLFKEVFGSAEKPAFAYSTALAVDQSNGDVLVLDRHGPGSAGSLSRFKANGEPSPFSALGTNRIDGAKGPGGKPCAEEAASCDEIPGDGFDGFGGVDDIQIAIDESGGATDGNIYLQEEENRTVSIFAADGHYLGQLTRFGTKLFGPINGVAVDSAGNVYVSDRSKDAIHKFDPAANPPVNTDFVTDIKTVTRPGGLAVGDGPSANSLFVTQRAGSAAPFSGGLYKLNLATGALQYVIEDGFFNLPTDPRTILNISVNPVNGHLLVAKTEGKRLNGSTEALIKEYDVSGPTGAVLLSRTPLKGFANGVAANGATGEVYGSRGGGPIDVFHGPIVTQPDVVTLPPSAVTPSNARVNGTVNPDGQALTECFFEYGKTIHSDDSNINYEASIPCVQTPGEIGAGTTQIAVHADLSGLPPNGRRNVNFRLVAKNSNDVDVVGFNQRFQTAETATAVPASGVSGAAAKLNGSVNPNGSAVTDCTFEYLPQAAFAAAAMDEEQTVTLTGATGGTFRLSFEGKVTEPIPFDASDGEVREALMELDSLGLSGVGVPDSPDGGPYTVRFDSEFGDTDVPELVADASGLTPSGATATVETHQDGAGWEGATSVPCAESPAQIGTGTSAVPVHTEISGLDSGTEYRFRLSGGNAGDGTQKARSKTFTTLDTVHTEAATAVGGSIATLNGTVNPAGVAVGECFFEYGTSSAYGQTVPCAESEAEIGTGTSPVSVHADLSGLDPHTNYHFQLIAGPNGAASPGGDEDFTTRGPGIDAQWVANVTATEAILRAEINPGGAPTTYHLEWGPSGAPYANSTPESASIGSDEAAHLISIPLSGLRANSTYHYRFVAANNCNPSVPAEVCVFEGPDQTFHTYPPPVAPSAACPNQSFRIGAAAKLPDCRAYEMVSPVEKNNGNIATESPRTASVNLPQAAVSGNRMAFSSQTSFEDAEAAPMASHYVSSRGIGGWSTENVSAPRDAVPLYELAGSTDIPFKVFSEDLCSGWILQGSDVALTPGAPSGVPNLYRRDNCGGGGYELISSAAPPGFGTEPGKQFVHYYPDILGFSADGSRSVFRANAALTSDATPVKGLSQVYVAWGAGNLRLVSVLPDGTSTTTSSTAGSASVPGITGGFREDNVYRAVSEDGSRVFWTDSNSASFSGTGSLYLRLNATEPQSAMAAGECVEEERACTIAVSESSNAFFWGADREAETAIYTTNGPGNGEYDVLHEFDVGAETSQQIATGVLGVMGVSDDASRIFFASTEDLATGATGGEPNLYLYERGEGFRFVATLSKDDARVVASWAAPPSPIAVVPMLRSARVSPDGLHAAFASTANLTGYDNTDSVSGAADTEIFVYDSTANHGTGELRCASCNPSAARPEGKIIYPGIDGAADDIWAAAEIPGWATQFQPTRALSADGSRVFFNAYDALLPGDTNGRKDVYQWEAPGSGDCTEDSANYFEANGGCISLISSGQSPKDSHFFDASESGSDVFFATQSSLLPQDPGLTDVYDARVNGGFPQPPPPPPPCIGDACQNVPAPPNDPTPASAGFRGAGDPRPKPAQPRCRKGKRKVQRRGKARCLSKRSGKGKQSKRVKRNKRRAAR